MNRVSVKIIRTTLILFFLAGVPLTAQTLKPQTIQKPLSDQGPQNTAEMQPAELPSSWPTIEDLCANQRRFGLLHNWGLSWAYITRIQKQSNRSNFVWSDKLIGAYYELATHDFLNMGENIHVNLFSRQAVYYPYEYKFNKVPQVTTQTILYNFDLFTGAALSLTLKDWVRLAIKPGLHVSYQLHDKFHFVNIGAGFGVEAEVPISSRWSANIGGIWTWDNGNMGSNARMRPFDYVWEYQAQVGFRYSKKCLNIKSFIRYRHRKPKEKKVRIYSDGKNKKGAT